MATQYSLKETKTILIAALLLALAFLIWKWYRAHSYITDLKMYNKELVDSLSNRSFSTDTSNVRLYMDSTGGSTTTVVALDKANNSGIGGVQVTITKRLAGQTVWTNLASGSTNADGTFPVGMALGGAASYRIRCVNGTKDDQVQQYSNTSLGTVTFYLKN